MCYKRGGLLQQIHLASVQVACRPAVMRAKRLSEFSTDVLIDALGELQDRIENIHEELDRRDDHVAS